MPETHTDELPDIYLHPAHYTNRLPRVNLIDVGQADVAPPQDGNLNLWRDISYHLSLFQQQNVPITPSTQQIVITTVEVAPRVEASTSTQQIVITTVEVAPSVEVKPSTQQIAIATVEVAPVVAGTPSTQQFVITTVEVAPHTQQIVHTVADVLHDPLLCPPGTEPNKFDFDFPPVLNTFKLEPLLKDTQSPQSQKDGANFNRILKAIRSAEKSKKTVAAVIAVSKLSLSVEIAEIVTACFAALMSVHRLQQQNTCRSESKQMMCGALS